MRPTKLVIVAGLLCAALSAGYLASQAKDNKAEVALQAAIKTETVDGNLKAAIEQYQKLADGGHRGVAAKALVRMGQCYEKLGDAQARKAYARVVRDFADQKEALAAAQALLAALDQPANGPSLAVRRVWAGPEANAEGAPSWDGRYLSFTDRNTANIALRDLATGETRNLTKNSDVGQYPAYRSILSPDGKKVAYTWITGDVFCEIRLIDSDGSGQRVLYSNKQLSGIELGVWSPDGACIAAALTLKNETTGLENYQIALISVRDGSARILKTLGSRRPNPRGFSPDGRFIAYDYPPEEGSESRDIVLLAADGSQDTPLVQHPADDQLLGWAPDGKGVLFASDRTGGWAAWFIPVENGKPKGQAELIKAELGGVEPLGFTRSGSFYYGIESGGMDAYVATLDPAAWQLPSAPTPINERSLGANQYPLFSPDGQSLAYFSNRTGNPWLLCVRSLKTGEEREFPVPHDLELLRTPRWAANGQSILVTGVDKQLHHNGFYLLDSRTGENRAILSSNPEADTLGGQWTPDGKSLFLARAGVAAADKASRVLQHDPATGNEREIFRAPSGEDITNLALSPDGLELAFTLRAQHGIRSYDGLWIMSAQGADAHELFRLNDRETIRRDGLIWTPDGRQLLFAKAIETPWHAFELELWRVSPRDNKPHKVGVLALDMTFDDGSSGLSIHPGGKSIAFHAGRRKPEVWAMENFQAAPRSEAVLNILHELTVEAWINISNLGSAPQTILAKGILDYDGTSYILHLNPQGKVKWGVRHSHVFFGEVGDWSIDGIVTDTELRPNTWYHLACTIYSSRSASIYVNGVLSKTGAITQSILSKPTEPLQIGFILHYGTPSFPFNGLIDEVMIYDRVLPLDEIQKHYQAGIQRHRSESPVSQTHYPISP